jgi:hypothetical protein
MPRCGGEICAQTVLELAGCLLGKGAEEYLLWLYAMKNNQVYRAPEQYPSLSRTWASHEE